jgi:hypothetical protein
VVPRGRWGSSATASSTAPPKPAQSERRLGRCSTARRRPPVSGGSECREGSSQNAHQVPERTKLQVGSGVSDARGPALGRRLGRLRDQAGGFRVASRGGSEGRTAPRYRSLAASRASPPTALRLTSIPQKLVQTLDRAHAGGYGLAGDRIAKFRSTPGPRGRRALPSKPSTSRRAPPLMAARKIVICSSIRARWD